MISILGARGREAKDDHPLTLNAPWSLRDSGGAMLCGADKAPFCS